MTGKDLINTLQALSEEDLARDIIIFDGPAYITPCRVVVMGKKWGKKLQGKLLID